MVKLPDQKILLLDIETKPTKVFVWRAYGEQFISPEQVIEDGGVICVGAKWLGEKTTWLFSDWEHGHIGMLEAIHEMMSYADAVITYNGDKFDLPILRGEFITNGLEDVPQCSSIDCVKAVRKFGFFMNKLAYIGPKLKVGEKIKTEGFELWVKVMAGEAAAQDKMAKYCKQDVVLLEKLYLFIRPYIRNHPHLGTIGGNECPVCGGKHAQSRGTYRTRMYKVQRLQCQSCYHWFGGSRKKI